MSEIIELARRAREASYALAEASRATKDAALHAMAPYLTTEQYYNGWTYQGGAFQLGFALQWSLGLAQAEVARRVPAALASEFATSRSVSPTTSGMTAPAVDR